MKLEFKNVTKQYGEVNAVNKVNCVMEKGIYGLLGVNGAGKTTLMRMLCTIVQPSEGQILWNGKDIWKLGGEYREVLGYLPQDFGYYPNYTAMEFLMYVAALKGIPKDMAKKRANELLEVVGLSNVANKKLSDEFGMSNIHMVMIKNGMSQKELSSMQKEIDKVDGVVNRSANSCPGRTYRWIRPE